MTSPAGLSPKAPSPVAPAPAAVAEDRQWFTDETNPIRRAAFLFAVLFVFLRFSFLHEIIVAVVRLNLYLLLLIGVPAVLLVFTAGGLRRTFQATSARLWALFTLWMFIATPFSNWRSDSAHMLLEYLRTTLPILVVIAGVTLTLKECYRMMAAFALAGLVNVMYAAIFSVGGMSRLGIVFGSIANSNDYAAHLLLILPFLLWVTLTSEWKLMKIGAIAVVVAGLYIGATTGSRGALIAILAVALFVVLRAPGSARLAGLVLIPLLGVGLVVLLPQHLKERYATIFSDTSSDDPTDEAVASRDARRYLLTTSIQLSLQHPLFGVGPGQFAITEGGQASASGKHGHWQVSHNTYTQVSSEDGIPGFIFFIAALIVTFRTLNSLYRKTRFQPQFRKLRAAAFCLMLSMVGFGVAIFFLSLAYTMYFPALIGMVIALERAYQHEMASGQRPPETRTAPPWKTPVYGRS